MENNKLNLKILASIFIVFFFVAIFHINSYAIDLEHYSDIESFVNSSSFYQNLYSQYDNIVLMYTGISGQSIRYNYLFSNNNELTLTSDENINNNTLDINVSGFDYNWYVYYYMSSGRVFSNDFNYGFPISTYIPYEDSPLSSVTQDFIIIKGSPVITYNGSPISSGDSYDFSFVINDHTFDFTMEDYTFSNGFTLSSDTIKEGHYVVNLSYYSENNYNIDTDNYKNYWALGYIDYFPYSDTDPKKQFYFSSGYETLKLYNGSNDNEVYYRLYFKGYSNDSSIQDFSNNIISSGSNNYGKWDKYSPVANTTFLYSNRDIYWATDTSLYGFNGFTNQRFYIESTDSVTVNNTVSNNFESEDPDTDSTVYALNNNVINTGSSSPIITNGDLYSYNGTAYGDIAPYYAIEEISGANIKGVDSSNFTTLDYVKQIPRLISEIPLGIIKAIVHIFVPSGNDLYEIYIDFQQLAQDKLGIFNAPISFIFTFIDQIKDKYTVGYSIYNFTIPGFRWFDMRTREKVTLVEPQTIDLNTYFVNDEDWLHFWGTLRYLVSFLIYLNLIIMLFNKYKAIIGGDKVNINNYKPIGDISRNDR